MAGSLTVFRVSGSLEVLKMFQCLVIRYFAWRKQMRRGVDGVELDVWRDIKVMFPSSLTTQQSGYVWRRGLMLGRIRYGPA